MLYYYLAESLCELGLLKYLIERLESSNFLVIEYRNSAFIKREIERIKARAAVDMLIFGDHTTIFLFRYIQEINRLIIRLLDILDDLSEFFSWTERQMVQYNYATILKEGLTDLCNYFTELKKLYQAGKD